ncbi:helix-turn-helix domain-containing protein [Jeotgalibaca arthritidis]|uniref:Helix-turn-helix transcriptional regulator n=1 Tax=Jeotgalibaca arthritidis TaxID=1868794 RepID=A0A6G7KBI7_9LACT|nr:helix-turn-helix transcriptional regulator [Jeotgalibaca arthritidis]QII82607.1 helix-turn-helix transcriptional regulator [Jeotgalibaca arthritidis]
MDINPNDVGDRIRQIRRNKGMSMTEFANLIGQVEKTSKIQSGTISNWETGKNLPNNKRLSIISGIAGISVDELLYGDIREYAATFLDTFIEDLIKDEDPDSFVTLLLKDLSQLKELKFQFITLVKEHGLSHSEIEAMKKLANETIFRFLRGEDDSNKGAINITYNTLKDLLSTVDNMFLDLKAGHDVTVYKDGMDATLHDKLTDILTEAINKTDNIKNNQ